MLSAWVKGNVARGAAILFAGLVATTSTITLGPDMAQARKRHHVSSGHAREHVARVRHRAPVGPANAATDPRFASIVIDVKAGKTLYAYQPDGLRHPASITKVMTLYMLFEQLQLGRLTLDTPLPVSAHAAAQSPTKLGLRPGTSIRVEDAIRGMVTRSANDAAVVVAEALGGTESNFAAMMTRKARSLGMRRTVYRNASGLPNAGQITTARDLAILGVAIQDRFPKYYRYFSTNSFVFRGQTIGNHNHLLGAVEGVDGIKTGYTNASGFNLLTSIKREDRQLVAVVMGGRTAASRDATMRQLIANYLPTAYAGLRRSSNTAFAAAEPEAPVKLAMADIPDDAGAAADTDAAPVALPTPAPLRIRAAVVAETPRPRANQPVAAPIKLASAEPQPVAPPQLPRLRPQDIARPAIAAAAGTGPVMRWVEGPAPVATAPATPPSRAIQTAEASPAPATTATVQPVRTQSITIGDLAQAAADMPAPAPAPAPAVSAATPAAEPAPTHSGWIIQIGATDSRGAAQKLLEKAQATGHGTLASAEPFTESVEKNGSTLWRARFAGFQDQRKALAACAALKSKDFACLPVRL